MALTPAERQLLWEQFVEVHAESQHAYDNSIRAIAAAGVGVTASLATALHGFPPTGVAAIALFLASLSLNLVSYVTAQFDMTSRMDALKDSRDDIEGNGWTKATTWLNVGAGVAVIGAGVLLALFIAAGT